MDTDTFTTELDYGWLGEIETKVKFTYYKGYPGSYDEPSESPEVTIEQVVLFQKQEKGPDIELDITKFVDEDFWNELVEKAFEYVEACREQAAVERAEANADDDVEW